MAIVVSLFLLLIFSVVRVLPKRRLPTIAKLSKEDLKQNLHTLAISLRLPESYGVGISASAILSPIKKAEIIIKNKEKKRRRLYEFEKYLVENSYLVKRYVNRSSIKSFNKLPHKSNEPRILTLSRAIVNSAGGDLTEQHVRYCVQEFCRVTPLYLEELYALKLSLLIALSENIALLGKKVKHYAVMTAQAKTGRYNPSLANSDCYLYHFLLRTGVEEIDNNQLNLRKETVQYSYSNSVLYNDKLAAESVNGIRVVERMTNNKLLIELSATARLLEADGQYKQMTTETQLSYLQRLSELSDKWNYSEKRLVEGLFNVAEKQNVYYGCLLFGNSTLLKRLLDEKASFDYAQKSKRLEREKEAFDFGVINAAVVAVSAILGFLCTANYYGLFLTLPFYFLLYSPIKSVYVKFLANAAAPRIVPQMAYGDVAPENRVEVVYALYATCTEDVDGCIDKLTSLAAVNNYQNTTFAILMDLPDKEEFGERDKALLAYARERAEGLEKGKYNLYVRKKTLCKDGYRPYERKRGAIEQYNNWLVGGNDDAFLFILDKDTPRAINVIILDEDNMLLPSAVLNAVNSLAHPMNEDKDLLCFQAHYNAFSAKSRFALRKIKESRIDKYPVVSDVYYNSYGKSVFCGKGIYRAAQMHQKLYEGFAENRLLSHDIIEGAVLNTGQLSEVVFEDVPEGVASDLRRSLRWSTGDVQLLSYLGGSYRNKVGKRVKSNVSPLYRQIIWSNFCAISAPFFFFVLLYCNLFLGNSVLWLTAALYVLLEFAVDFCVYIANNLTEIKLRYVIKDLLQMVARLVKELLFFPYYAITNALLLIRVTATLLNRNKSLLVWKPFRQAQKENSLSQHLQCFIISYAVVTALSILSLKLYALIYSIGYIVYTFLTYSACKKPATKRVLLSSDKLRLKEYAEKTMSFFNECADKSTGFICDNFQIKPYYVGCSKNTSPTNIGMSIMAYVGAVALGIETAEAAIAKLSLIISSAVSCEKWNGHLYNWLDVSTLQPLQPAFVSSVDSANFVASLYVLRAFLMDEAKKNQSARQQKHIVKLYQQTEKLIADTDFSALYDVERKQFYIGYSLSNACAEGHYDLLSSEAVLISFMGILQGTPREHYYALFRDYCGARGNTLISWSGTMFEYLLPSLFLSYPPKSLLSENSAKVCALQARYSCGGLIGASESGYYAFDKNLRYQYGSFGLPILALKNEQSSCVVAPYASFLALRFKTQRYLHNIYSFENKGALGNYGFFESIDLRNGKPRIVYEYMSHHQGMILASIANLLCDNYLTKLFARTTGMDSAKLLLQESTDRGRYKQIKREGYELSLRAEVGYNKNLLIKSKQSQIRAACNVLSCGEVSCLFDESGRNHVNYAGRCVYGDGLKGSGGSIVYALDSDGRLLCPTLQMGGGAELSVTFKPGTVRYRNHTQGISAETLLPPDLDGLITSVTIENSTENVKEYLLYFYAELSLLAKEEESKRSAFANMMVSTSFSQKDNALFAMRRGLFGAKDCHFACYTENMTVKAESNRFNFLGRGHNKIHPYLAEHHSRIIKQNGRMSTMEELDCEKHYPSIGDVLSPCVGLYGKVRVEAGKSKTVNFYQLLSKNRGELQRKLELVQNDSLEAFKKLMSLKGDVEGDSALNQEEFNVLNNLYRISLSALSAKQKSILCSMPQLREHVSNTGKGLYLKEASLLNGEAEALLKPLRLLQEVGLQPKLTVFYNESVGYLEKGKRQIEAILQRYAIDAALLEYNQADALVQNAVTTLALPLNEALTERGLMRETDEIKLIQTDKVKRKNEFILSSGEGGFVADSIYEIRPFEETTLLPYSNVVAGSEGGFAVTEGGGGFTFFGNSQTQKVNRFYHDEVTARSSERVLLRAGKNRYTLNDINKGNGIVTHSIGCSQFHNKAEGISADVIMQMVENGAVKLIDVAYVSQKTVLDCSIEYLLEMQLGDGACVVQATGNGKLLCIENCLNGEAVYLGCSAAFFHEYLSAKDCFSALGESCIVQGEGVYVTIPISAVSGEKRSFRIVLSRSKELVEKYASSTVKQINSLFDRINSIRLESNCVWLDVLFNNWLKYAAVSARLNGRLGFYQVSGAIGFRDQLQDVLCLLYSDSASVKRHILLCAERQYLQGDVMHWWHPERTGVRTRITDDRLFLPYAVNSYVAFTGDKSILSVMVPFLSSAPLEQGEKSRYETPELSENATVYDHCVAAIDSVLKYGKHGLLLMKGGDWNDALDEIGGESGESVWLSMFCYEVIGDFLNYAAQEDKARLAIAMSKLRDAVNDYGFNGSWFSRAYTKDGEWLGQPTSSVIKLDLLTQAYAVISGITDRERAEKAMDSASALIDKELGLVKLLEPPVTDVSYGYIGAYPAGVRENGGQYTHAVCWYIRALCRLGRKNEAFSVLSAIAPTNKCRSIENTYIYKGEPYVLSGDVYTNKDNAGRSGWSFYTGSAAWLYRVILEDIIGIKVENGCFSFNVDLPDAMPQVSLSYRHEEAVYNIHVFPAETQSLTFNGVKLNPTERIRQEKNGKYQIEIGYVKEKQ